ncbi:uncharacterized protein H6S33_010376 [Morchella sextelata]|jgi:hypothetical protein|uniref:uncharacterized protein n=1 Tax=Morchella sextelata TaxID=1174677 RepID=UPI001D03896F|nr:uncharacterized protein H6S33_010376 [Morchella sextelata]KAH0612324.1 hypothetical protein H6S33_010376 [Morchella sextelata]
MSLPTLPLNVLAAIVTKGQLQLRDIASIRHVCRDWNTAFSQPTLCASLLGHFFPFAQETYDATTATAGKKRYDDFNAVCSRLHRLKTGKWSLNWEVAFPAPPHMDSYAVPEIFPPDGFRLVDTDSDEGYFLTAYAEDNLMSVRITVRNLINGQDIHVSIPREELSGIYMNRGKVLLVYSRGDNSSMFILTDCRDGGNGRTLWSANINTSVFHGVVENDSTAGRRRLQPVFNEHYIAFLNSLDNSGGSRIMIMRFHALTSSNDLSTETELLELQLSISPATLISLKPDTSGFHLLLAQKFPHHQFPDHENLHRVVLVQATSGKVSCAFNFIVAPYFSLVPERDMEMFFSPSGDSVIIWGSIRCEEYRGGGILGQVMIYPIFGGPATIRYLQSPDKGADPVEKNTETRYAPDLGVISYGHTVVGFESLNLDFRPAGTGAHINAFNNPPSAWNTIPTKHPLPSLEIGSHWIYSESTAPNGDVTIEMMRIAPPPLLIPENQWTSPNSKRSSWFLNSSTTTAPGSSAASILGVGLHPADAAAQIAQVDAEELAARLKMMERERARETKRKSWEEVKKGWKAKLFGWR